MTNSRLEYHKNKKISTHTLTWSVTIDDYCQKSNISNFNSHAHVERDAWHTSMPSLFEYFNSHAHVERDNDAHSLFAHLGNFNSHAHVERDNQII